MKTSTKRLIAAASVIVMAAFLEWLSGLPWERSPDMAGWWGAVAFIALVAAAVPREDA